MEHQVIEKTNEVIKQIIDEGINPNNLESLYKLTKIKHIAKEDKENMNYGHYYDDRRDYYGRDYDNYGRRERDSRGRYRGHEHLDRMYEDYGRYMENRSRYGGGSEDSKKSLRYMLESMEDFARMLREDAGSQEEVEMIRQTAQRIAQL